MQTVTTATCEQSADSAAAGLMSEAGYQLAKFLICPVSQRYTGETRARE